MEPKPSRARLMILDNDRGLVDLAAWYLERQGYLVDKATSFREARHLLATDPPDLLLSDVEMGEESGAEELPRLSAEGLLPPTLVISGFLDAELAERLRCLPGVLGTLAKPFDLPDLEQRLEDCLARVAAGECESSRPRGVQATMAPMDSDTEVGADLSGLTEDADGWIEVPPADPTADSTDRASWRG